MQVFHNQPISNPTKDPISQLAVNESISHQNWTKHLNHQTRHQLAQLSRSPVVLLTSWATPWRSAAWSLCHQEQCECGPPHLASGCSHFLPPPSVLGKERYEVFFLFWKTTRSPDYEQYIQPQVKTSAVGTKQQGAQCLPLQHPIAGLVWWSKDWYHARLWHWWFC